MIIINKIKDIIFKIKDYDRLEQDYNRIICHATCGVLSKTGYKVGFACDVIDEQQKEKYKECENKEIKKQKQRAVKAFKNILLYISIHHLRLTELDELKYKFKKMLDEK